MTDIFVSYSRADKARVAPLVKALEAEGWTVWWDPEITPGEEFDALISRELEGARSLIVVWTPNSVDSRWVRGEARDAADRGVLVPVRFDNAKLPIDFRALHTTDLDGWNEDSSGAAFKSLRKALAAMLGAPTKPAEEASTNRRPQAGICVLPFANMSGDPEQEYFSDGITEDIITDLGKVSSLAVVSRKMAFSLKGASGGAGEIGRQTKASHVLLGSVRRAGERVRITAQLIDAATETQVWGERYDRELSDIFALQDEISKAIVGALKLTLAPEEKQALEQRSTNNVEAYNLYLMARQFSVMGSERHYPIIVRICKRAVELDPGYARAWATLSLAQRNLNFNNEASDDGLRAAERAVALDPHLAEAHAALAAVYRDKGRYDAAIAECESALRLDPQSYDSNRIAGIIYFSVGRYDDSIRHLEVAAAAIDTEFYASAFIVQCCDAKGDVAGAQVAAKRLLARVERVIAAEPDHTRALGYGVAALATLGETERAKHWIARGRLLDPDNVNQRYNFACAYALMGETDQALEALQSALSNAGEAMLNWMQKDSDLDRIREDPRFKAMVDVAGRRIAAEAERAPPTEQVMEPST